MPKKILFVIPNLCTGGAERQLALLVRGIAEELFEPHVAVFCSGGQFWEEISQLTKCNLYNLERKGRWDFSVVRKLIRYILEKDIDLIQGWMPPTNTFAAIAGLLTLRPVVMGVRASNADYPSLGGRLYVRIDGLFSRFSKRIICNSISGADYHKKVGYSKQKIQVIQNGVPIPEDIVFPDPFQHPPPWNIGMLARVDPMKDHPNMFSAMKILKDNGLNVVLHLFGDGQNDYIQKLKKIAKKLLPPALNINRKWGFAIPIADWFRGPLLHEVRELLVNNINQWINIGEVDKLLNEHRAGIDHSARLFSLLVLSLWVSTNYSNK